MASNNLTLMENLITCGLCSEIYDDPRLLPCSHTYCFRCINQIFSTNKNLLACPSCNESEMTQNEIDSLPSNRIIADIVELYGLMQRSTMCSNCDLSEAEYICDICQISCCSECYEVIHTPRALRNHRKMSINQKFPERLLCERHTDQKLKHWCQECRTPVCSDCLLHEHHDHTYTFITETAKELETKIKADLEIIQSSLNDKIKQANEEIHQIHTNSQSNKLHVNKAMRFLRQIIDEHEKQMLQDIENFQREDIQRIEKYQILLENQLKYSHIQKEALEIIISVNDQIRLLQNKIEFSNYVNQTFEISDRLQIPAGTDYHLSGLEQLQNLKEQILQCARVTETAKQIVPLSTDEQPEIEKFIATYQTSQEVNLNGQSLTDQNIHCIVELLKKSTKMVTLNLSNNQIGPEGVEYLADVLQCNKILNTLDLSNNEISDDGTKYLANVLKTNTTLTTLYLYDNGISEQGTEYLTDALKINTTLTVLDLQSNRISYLGAQHLADALRKNNTLATLYLSNNQIGNQGARFLADALQQNKTLIALALSDNQIDYEAKRRVIEILKTNTNLRVYW